MALIACNHTVCEPVDTVLLQPYSIESGSLLPVVFNIFSFWRLTGQQQMTLLRLSNEKTLYNWKNQPEKAMLTRDCLERGSYFRRSSS